MLFLVNFIAIEFAAASIFMLLGLVDFHPRGAGSPVLEVARRLGISFIILLLATSFMTRTLIQIVQEKKLENNIRTSLTRQLVDFAGARLSDTKFEQEGEILQVVATVITPQEFDSARIANLERGLQEDVNPYTQLIVRSVVSKTPTERAVCHVEELKRRHQDSQETDYMNGVSQGLARKKRPLMEPRY